MLRFFYRLFIVGFPSTPKCQHEWSKWQTIKSMSASTGEFLIVQARYCSKCGFTDINKTEV